MDSISDIIYKGLKVSSRGWDRTRRYTKRYIFNKRSTNSKYLVMILAGYQDYVWDDVFKRISNFVPENYDVCIVSAGVRKEKLEKIAEKYGWSYLSTKANKLAMALNTTIKLHPKAEYIFKLDEDIFVGVHFFDELLDTYHFANNDGIYKIGFVAPVMNVNGASYRYFLKKIGCLSEYEEKYGIARITCDDDNVFKNGQSAKFLWSKSFPFDDIVNLFLNNQEKEYFTSPIRYSIGAILIHRERWNEAGGFISSGNGQLAWDELELCRFCMNSSSAIIISTKVFAGHFGFGKQKADMIPFYEKNKEKFGIFN